MVVSHSLKETHLEIMTHANGQGHLSSLWLEFLYLGKTFSPSVRLKIILMFLTMNNKSSWLKKAWYIL